MNTVTTCHDYHRTTDSVAKHAWTLGKETITALQGSDDDKIGKRLGKLVFPHKQDNVATFRFISAVFIAAKNKNFEY